jgi:hypothetical protein
LRKGSKITEEMRAKLRSARAAQVHPSLAARGLTLADVEAASAKGLRWCSGQCKAFVDSELFGKHKKTTKCRACVAASVAAVRRKRTPDEIAAANEELKAWREVNAVHVRNEELKRKFGVDSNWYDLQLSRQNGRCALCPATKNSGKRRFFNVDHDHTTGAVRELLCNPCNYLLGFFEKRGQVRKLDENGIPDVRWAAAAAAYLLRHRRPA